MECGGVPCLSPCRWEVVGRFCSFSWPKPRRNPRFVDARQQRSRVMLDLETVGAMCRRHGALLHSDTVQSMGHYRLDLGAIDIDFLTCSAHKLHGPKGVGFLYINPQLRIDGMIVGGGQERMLRGGTERGRHRGVDRAFAHARAHERPRIACSTHETADGRGFEKTFARRRFQWGP